MRLPFLWPCRPSHVVRTPVSNRAISAKYPTPHVRPAVRKPPYPQRTEAYKAKHSRWLQSDFQGQNAQAVPLKSPYRSISESSRTKPIRVYPPLPSRRKAHPFPLEDFTAAHLKVLDPTGSRGRFLARDNPEGPRVGDILLATFKNGDPFAGVCLNIRHRGVDTAILLRTKKMTVGVEMWIKVYSPDLRAIEVVKRSEKKQRRARLYFMRLPKHDKGSVDSEVEQYLSRRRLIRSGAVGSSGA